MIDLQKLKDTIALLETYEEKIQADEYRDQAHTVGEVIKVLEQDTSPARGMADEARQLLARCIPYAGQRSFSEQGTRRRHHAAFKLRDLVKAIEHLQEGETNDQR